MVMPSVFSSPRLARIAWVIASSGSVLNSRCCAPFVGRSCSIWYMRLHVAAARTRDARLTGVSNTRRHASVFRSCSAAASAKTLIEAEVISGVTLTKTV